MRLVIHHDRLASLQSRDVDDVQRQFRGLIVSRPRRFKRFTAMNAGYEGEGEGDRPYPSLLPYAAAFSTSERQAANSRIRRTFTLDSLPLHIGIYNLNKKIKMEAIVMIQKVFAGNGCFMRNCLDCLHERLVQAVTVPR